MKKLSKSKSTKIIPPALPSAKNLLSQWLLLSFGEGKIDSDILAHKTIDYLLTNTDPKLSLKHEDFSIELLNKLLNQTAG